LGMMQGLLEVIKDAGVIEKQVHESEQLAKSLEATRADVDKYVSDLQHYGKYAVDSYTSLLEAMANDPGMMAALKAQPVGGSVPLTHDIARSLLEPEGVSPDLTKPRALLKAMSAVQGTTNVVPELIKHGVTSEIAKYRDDGSLDHTKTLENMRSKGDTVRNYVRNLHELLDTTPGLNPEQVKASKEYLGHVSDALEVADNDLVSKVFHRVYSPSEKTDVRGELEKTLGANIKKTAYSGARGGSNPWMIWSTVADVAANFFHGKGAIDAAILKKLDDPKFVNDVSRLKEGYSKQRAADVRAQAEKSFTDQTQSEPRGLLDPLKAVLGAIFPGSAVSMGFMDRAKAFGKWYNKAMRDALPYMQEQKRLNDKFNQNFTSQQPDQEPDENIKIMMNWKG
jgi:hypothetical protein